LSVANLYQYFPSKDDLVLAVPLTAETRLMIGQREFDLMRPGSRLVNVGRGELLDEAALITALQSGHLAGAGLDVFTTEPLPADSPLWAMPNVIITPHTSGETPIAMHRAIEIFVDNLGRFLRGDPLVNEVTR
jgi:phosphoglycerate dehydrogenase-like enzyme